MQSRGPVACALVSGVSSTQILKVLCLMFVAANDPASDRINLIRAAFSAFSAVGDAFGPGMKEEVRAVAVSIYAGRYHLFNPSR